jgi:hypothetical protein
MVGIVPPITRAKPARKQTGASNALFLRVIDLGNFFLAQGPVEDHYLIQQPVEIIKLIPGMRRIVILKMTDPE